MLLHIVHETSYRYMPAVENAHHMVYLKPASNERQALQSYDLQVHPAPVQLRDTLDMYGNTRSYFSLQAAHNRLSVVAESVVATSSAPPLLQMAGAWMPWERVREQFRYQAGAAYDSASEFLFPSPYIPRDDAFAEFARPSFLSGRPLPEAARDLMNRIHTNLRYETASTQVNTPALEALKQGKGVCQDFAHIMVACCRALGLPARYVSGYMLTNPPPGQPRLIGCDASHAWASVYLPGLRQWLDFDPTNNRTPGEDYVTLATGRDFLDVSPMRGVIRGGAQHILEVAVTVEPLNEAAQRQTASASAT